MPQSPPVLRPDPVGVSVHPDRPTCFPAVTVHAAGRMLGPASVCVSLPSPCRCEVRISQQPVPGHGCTWRVTFLNLLCSVLIAGVRSLFSSVKTVSMRTLENKETVCICLM